MTYPSRAHRRFLGLTLPHQQVPDHDDYVLPRNLRISPWARKSMHEHLSTAGQQRGGILLGMQEGETLHITGCLPNGYNYSASDPYLPDAQYVLGAVEAAQQHAEFPIDWVGCWAMPASAILTLEWCEQVWEGYKARGLLPLGVPLITIGTTEVGLTYLGWIDYGEGRVGLKKKQEAE